MSSSIIYLVASEKQYPMSFTSLEEARKYAIQKGMSWVRRFKQGRMGTYYEISPIEIKNDKRR